jgi:hypothetical protein
LLFLINSYSKTMENYVCVYISFSCKRKTLQTSLVVTRNKNCDDDGNKSSPTLNRTSCGDSVCFLIENIYIFWAFTSGIPSVEMESTVCLWNVIGMFIFKVLFEIKLLKLSNIHGSISLRWKNSYFTVPSALKSLVAFRSLFGVVGFL